jgi:septation ring formation regulator EzrA
MTLQDLRQYPSLKAEIKRLDRRLHELRLELANDENISLKNDIAELYATLEKLHKRQLMKEAVITKWLETIDDAQVRLSVQLHYIDGYTWNEVADEIGGGNTEDSCRKYVSRYFHKVVR